MLGNRGLFCALLVGLGVSLAGCVQPTVYSGAYLSRYGPVYGGLYYDGGGYYWPYFHTGAAAGPYCRGPYYGGYFGCKAARTWHPDGKV
jgi:hypothetical protein